MVNFIDDKKSKNIWHNYIKIYNNIKSFTILNNKEIYFIIITFKHLFFK
jgi:hypothetical protein